MLTSLYIKNYAIIDELQFEPSKGLSVVTGETGAGKSIMVGALNMLLGKRADKTVLKTKTDKCIVEGWFSDSDTRLKGVFGELELDYSQAICFRRELTPQGRSRSFINDTPVKLDMMREVGEMLMHIHSQHQNLRLGDAGFQMSVLDQFSGQWDAFLEYKRSFESLKHQRIELEEMLRDQQKAASDREYFQFQINEWSEANVLENEDETLQKELEKLENAESLIETFLAANEMLNSESGALDILNGLEQKLSELNTISAVNEITKRVQSVRLDLEDIASEVEQQAGNTELSPERLQQVQDRLNSVNQLLFKHRVQSVADLNQLAADWQMKLDTVENLEDRITTQAKAVNETEELCKKIAAQLNKQRKSAGPKLANEIQHRLAKLGMEQSKIEIALTDENELNRFGMNKVQFRFAPNPGLPAESLSKIASGGEISRVMLVLQAILSERSNIPTMLLDEIDNGISGGVADKVGQQLAAMGKYSQIIAITHLPQVAARGKSQFHVEKAKGENATSTAMKHLAQEERIMVIAQMLSGVDTTEAAVENARELLN